MEYKYTAYYEKETDRIKAIAEEILREYPRLRDLAIKAAVMEEPFGREHEDYALFSDQENRINRLINIVIVTEGKEEFQEEHNKATEDLFRYYESWKRGFTYANPEEQGVYLVMQTYNKHMQDKNVPLITLKEANKEQQRRAKEKELKRKSDRLKVEYPGLNEVADEVIKEEYDSGIWMRFQENDIIRLVLIIKHIEHKKGYEELYNNCLQKLKQMYSQWLAFEGKFLTKDKELVIEMMNRFNTHLENPTIPITTFAEIKAEELEQRNRG